MADFERPDDTPRGPQRPWDPGFLSGADEGPGGSTERPRMVERADVAIVETSDLVPDEFHFMEYVKVVHKRRWFALTIFILVSGIATVWTFTTKPVYQATTRLLIEADNPNVISFKEVINEDQGQAAYYQTQYNILSSRTLARRTLQDLHMLDKGAAAPAPGLRVAGAVEWARAIFSAQPPDAHYPNETTAESRAVDSFLSHLRVAPVRNSRLVDLRFTSGDPDLAVRVLNTHARQYIEQNLEYKFLSSKEASDWLAKRLNEQRQQVESAELALQRYREQQDAVSLDERQNIVVQKLADLNGAVTHAKTERIDKEAFYNQIQSVQNNPAAIDSIPGVLSNAYIQSLKTEIANLQRQQADLSEQLGDRHPDIVKIKTQIQLAQSRMQAEIGKILESFRHEYEAAADRERNLMQALDAQKLEALALNRKGIEYGVLRRDVESSRQIYDSLLQRVKETGVSTELKTSNIRIVDPAERPRNPILPQRQQDVLTGLLAGIVLALGFAFGFEYLDDRVKTPEDIKTRLRIPSLGLIPTIPPKDLAGGGIPLINNGVPPNFGEAFRTVRTNVLFSTAEEGARTIVITSAGPGEGKTVVSGNLAIALANAGQRVLLLDADLRRPKAHELFGLAQDPGLSHLLIGSVRSREAVQQTSIAGLWVLPAGRVPPNPAELLASRRFADFLGALREHFDWVIIDTPPVMAVTDACVVAHSTSGVILVTAAEMTSRPAARQALEHLRSARATVLGGILNKVDLHKDSYYYSRYYRPEYQAHYTQTSV